MAKLSKTAIRKNVGISMLIALVIVLQFLSYIIPNPLPFNLSLVLVPIVIAGIYYDVKAASLVGLFFGLFVSVSCAIGLDKSGLLVFQTNPLMCVLMCTGKGVLCGTLSALVFCPFRNRNNGLRTVGCLLAAIVCPVVNTGIFVTMMFVFFRELLRSWAGGTDLLTYIIVGLVGINFILEVIVNLVLCPPLAIALGHNRKHTQKIDVNE